MHGKSRRGILIVVIVAAIVAGMAWMIDGEDPTIEDAVAVPRVPRLSPDYVGIVAPPNIAPLNFSICEQGSRFLVRIRSEAGDPVEIVSRSPRIAIPPRGWRRLLEANRGKDLLFEVFAEVENQWRHYQTVVNHIAEDDIDRWLVYRRIGPIYALWRQTAIRQRDLSTFAESTVIDGASLEEGCVNCHTFPRNDPKSMLIGIRSERFGNATLHVADGKTEKLQAVFGFSAWHPTGRMAVYTTSRVYQFYHLAGTDTRDGIDWDGDLAYYRVQAHESKMVPCRSKEQRVKIYPAWSPDGRYLYYCSAPVLWTDRSVFPPKRYAEVKADLMRIRYDIDSDQWGVPETVLSTAQTGLSVLMPRISPDGKFLLFCMCRYGLFPVLMRDSDLYLMDLAKGTYTKPEINSEYSESWHSWSGNSRWFAFSSKRGGGTFTRCYVSFVDPTGRAHKPFLLPQNDPEVYDHSLEMFSLPELLNAPVTVSHTLLERAARSESAIRVDLPPEATRKTGGSEASEHAVE